MKNECPLLLGIFPNRELAEGAIDELEHAGYTADDIGIVTPGGKIEKAELPTGHQEDAAAEGAGIGALTGGGVGMLAGALVAATIPGIGLAVTGGVLTILAGATAAGAALGAFAGPFVAMGLTEDEAKHYENEFKAGRTIVAVCVRDLEHQDEVVTILRGHGATTIKTRDGQVLAPSAVVTG